MKDRGIYEVGKPFYMKVVFTGEEINPETDEVITKAMLRYGDLLPGLRLESVFAKFVNKDLLVVDSFVDDLEKLRNTFDEFIRKYKYVCADIREENIKKLREE